MELWNIWLALVNELRGSCSRQRTFFWMAIILMGFTIKFDFLGVTSLARGVGLLPNYYTCLLNLFNSSAIDLLVLRSHWITLIFQRFSSLVYLNGRCLIIADGIKIGKEGKKMPAVKWLHQDSESNSKAEYIMGHSLQVTAILAKGLKTYLAVPLAGEIHEGIRLHWRESKTLLDKLFAMLIDLKLPQACYLMADKYYCSGGFMKQLIENNIHLITMMKKNAVAYYPPDPEPKRRGRPRKYGKKIKLFDLFKQPLTFTQTTMPNDTKIIIEYATMQLLWRPLGQLVQFVLVRHPTYGNKIAMTTDLNLAPLDIILGYSLRFKIEVTFKQAIYQIGVFMYRFWLRIMVPNKRKSGDQQLQFASKDFKEKVNAKIRAYHLFIQLGFIAQGLIHYLSIHYYPLVREHFGTWLRTNRANTLPSEKVVALALSRTYLEFLLDVTKESIFKLFLRQRISMGQFQSILVEKIE